MGVGRQGVRACVRGAGRCAVVGKGRSRAMATAFVSPWLCVFKQRDVRKRQAFYLTFGVNHADGRMAKGGRAFAIATRGEVVRLHANPQRRRLDRRMVLGQQHAVVSGDSTEKGGVENRSRGIVEAACLFAWTWVAGAYSWARTALDQPNRCNKACLFALDQLAMHVPKFCLFA